MGDWSNSGRWPSSGNWERNANGRAADPNPLAEYFDERANQERRKSYVNLGAGALTGAAAIGVPATAPVAAPAFAALIANALRRANASGNHQDAAAMWSMAPFGNEVERPPQANTFRAR